ncbi:MAG: hypothetical protein AAF715_28245 [Myxococcota bacterium]
MLAMTIGFGTGARLRTTVLVTALATAGLVGEPARAQSAEDEPASPAEPPGPAAPAPGWNALEESDEPDEAPPPDAEPPSDASGSPYLVAPPPLPPDDASPANDDDAPPPSDIGGGGPEEIAWMAKDWRPRPLVRHARLEADAFTFDGGSVLTLDAVAQIGFDEDVLGFLDVIVPMAILLVEEPFDDTVVAGNIVVGGHGGDVFAEGRVAVWGGAHIAIPTTVDPEARSLSAAAALLTASRMRGGAEAHRFAPLNVPLRAHVGVAGQIHPLVYDRLEFAGAAWVSTLDETERGGQSDVFGVVELANELEVVSPWGPGVGLRAQYVANVRADTEAQTQLAVEPYATYRPPFAGPFAFPLVARVGVLFPVADGDLLEPDDGDVLWILRTMIGGRF